MRKLLFLHSSFFPSGPTDKASKLAQLVEENLENYYKTDEKSQIKVENKLKCLLLVLEQALTVDSTEPDFID